MTVRESFQSRRITLRLLSYWEKLRRGRQMPAESDLNPDHIEDLWGHCFLIHTKELGDNVDYHYTHFGSEIKKAYQGDLSDTQVEDLISPNAKHIIGCFQKIIATHKPLVDEGEFRNLKGDVVKYRQCMLPMGDGDQVHAIFGGMRYKIFSSK